MLELIKSEPFWAALSALATLGGAVAILFAARQLRFQAWVKAQEIWSFNDFTVARGKIFARLNDLQASWTSEDKALGLYVCRRIDEFVRLAPYLGQRRMHAVWGDTLAKAWVVLEPLVSEERKATTQPTKWDAFERLGRKSLWAHDHICKQVLPFQTAAKRFP